MELRDDLMLLRPWCEGDTDAVYAACQDGEIQRWIPVIPRPYTRDHARTFVNGEHGLGRHQFAVEQEGEVVGAIGMGVDEKNKIGRVGYWCTKEARGQGITTRALRRLCHHAFGELELDRVELITDPENVASQRVAEKVGFRREGVLRSHQRHPDGHRRDSVMFSLLPGEVR